jgi:hypothetical protein
MLLPRYVRKGRKQGGMYSRSVWPGHTACTGLYLPWPVLSGLSSVLSRMSFSFGGLARYTVLQPR